MYYRPILVMDCERIMKLSTQNPWYVTSQIIKECLMFMINYIRKVMFLEGHVDYWHFLMNFGNLSVF